MRRILVVLGFCLATAIPVAARSQTVLRGPYLQNGTPDAVSVRWRTDVPTDARVRYGSSPGALTLTASVATVDTDHEVRLTGLSPATTYFYAVGDSACDLAGDDPDHWFTTSPVPGDPGSIRIWVLGDSGTANSDAEAVRDAYLSLAATESREADFWLMLGDNAYTDGTDAEYQSAVFDLYPSVLRTKVLWSTMGNHDARTMDGSVSGPDMGYYYFQIFTFPENGEGGGYPSGSENYYSFDYGNVHLICLDANYRDGFGVEPWIDSPMMTWAAADLAMTTQEWIIAFWHHPPYSRGSHSDDSTVKENFLPVLEEGGVDLVLSGHSHSYERSFLLDGLYLSDTPAPVNLVDSGDGRLDGDGAYMKPARITPHNGAVYMVAGSSGKTSGGSLDHPIMVTSLNELGSVVIDAQANQMDVRFLRDTGAVADYFTLLKEPSNPVVPPGSDGGTDAGGDGGTAAGSDGGTDSGMTIAGFDGPLVARGGCGCRLGAGTGEGIPPTSLWAFGLLVAVCARRLRRPLR